jgi:hypothetical protein
VVGRGALHTKDTLDSGCGQSYRALLDHTQDTWTEHLAVEKPRAYQVDQPGAGHLGGSAYFEMLCLGRRVVVVVSWLCGCGRMLLRKVLARDMYGM